jgi:hypothetical protein
MSHLTYTWLDGELRVDAPDELKPVALLLQTDMVQFPALLAQAVDHASRRGEQWSTGGNVGWIDLDGERVTVSNQHRDDEEVTVSREQFLEILEEFQRELATRPAGPA